jgi:hypothetical protein
MVERFGKDPQQLANQLVNMRQALINSGNGSVKALNIISKAIQATGKQGVKSKEQIKLLTDQLKAMASTESRVVGFANAMQKLSDSVSSYLEARWSLGNAQMEIAAGWEEISNSARGAASSVEDVSAQLAKISASRGILSQQLKIAEKYGDTLRANQLRAEIAGLDAEKKELETKPPTTTQATPLADLLAQQQALQNMVNSYIQIGSAEILNASTKKEAREAVAGTVTEFEKQAKAAGVSEENVKNYAKELKAGLEMARKLNEPVKYKINAQTTKALADVRAFSASATASINAIPRTVEVSVVQVGSAPAPKPDPKAPKPKPKGLFASGGLVTGPGSGTSDSILARISNGEYVVRASAVKTYGVDFLNALNNNSLQRSMPSFGGSSAIMGEQMVYLSPEDRQLLRAAIDRPINLYTDNTKIAQSANAGNVTLAQRGIN